jgi:hypothetical protein
MHESPWYYCQIATTAVLWNTQNSFVLINQGLFTVWDYLNNFKIFFVAIS